MSRMIAPRGPVYTECPVCEVECDAYAGECPTCGTTFQVTFYAVALEGMCASAYPYTLDGDICPCTLPMGHDGDHESENPVFGGVRAWVQGA